MHHLRKILESVRPTMSGHFSRREIFYIVVVKNEIDYNIKGRSSVIMNESKKYLSAI